jgi:hypothetical protein
MSLIQGFPCLSILFYVPSLSDEYVAYIVTLTPLVWSQPYDILLNCRPLSQTMRSEIEAESTPIGPTHPTDRSVHNVPKPVLRADTRFG